MPLFQRDYLRVWTFRSSSLAKSAHWHIAAIRRYWTDFGTTDTAIGTPGFNGTFSPNANGFYHSNQNKRWPDQITPILSLYDSFYLLIDCIFPMDMIKRWSYNQRIIADSIKKITAGTDFLNESPIFICINIAPIISAAMPIAGINSICSNHMEAIKAKEKRTFRLPIKVINHIGNP